MFAIDLTSRVTALAVIPCDSQPTSDVLQQSTLQCRTTAASRADLCCSQSRLLTVTRKPAQQGCHQLMVLANVLTDQDLAQHATDKICQCCAVCRVHHQCPVSLKATAASTAAAPTAAATAAG